MSRLTCPYCEAELEDPDECYEQDTTYWWECSHCEKEFVFTLDYSVLYYPKKADCLNGDEHDWRSTPTYPREYTRMRCRMCDQQRDMTDAERAVVCGREG